MVQQWLLKVLLGKKLENMMNEKWEELDVRVVGTIHLSLTHKIKYIVLNKKYPSQLREKLEKIDISKSLNK